jgi:hypothetical protein
VDLPTINPRQSLWAAIVFTALSTYWTSAALEPGICGVPTQTKCTVAPEMASPTSWVKRNKPLVSTAVSKSSNPGS